MGTTILLFLIPLAAWIVIGKLIFKHEFTLEEMGIQAAITGVVLIALSFAGYTSLTSDEKMVNGVVTKLNPQKESCNMFWSDWPDGFCTNQDTRRVRDGQTCTTINEKRTCTPKYKTQYRSVYPWERRYFIETSIGGYEISRVDPQGVNMPPRFAEVKMNDPVTGFVTYTNYIKGAASTLFNQKLEEVPQIQYPNIFDYYKVNRVFYTDLPAPDFIGEWNEDLAQLNTDIRDTGANVIINVTSKDQTWAEGLSQAWDAHNINDVVVTIGVSADKISWVDVRSWTSNEVSDITIRDEILNLGVVDKDKINDIIQNAIMKFYKMQDMEDFEYLAEDIPPPTWLLVIAGIILLIVTPAVTWYLSNNDKNSSGVRLSDFNYRNKRF